jgi:DNA helicase-2/ATP-dependent DNA helicase PcrA
VRLLQHDDATREAWNRRLSYVMIDEYQDTNRSQYELMRLLTEQHRNVCVVGDEDQSIYSWRGADIRNILDFERDFPSPHHPPGAELPLDQEHSGGGRRGGGEQQGAQGQEALDRGRAGDLIGLYAGFDAENEALFIADATEKHLAGTPATTWRFSTAPISNRGRSKRRCGATGASTTSWAASASTSGRKSRTRWRT